MNKPSLKQVVTMMHDDTKIIRVTKMKQNSIKHYFEKHQNHSGKSNRDLKL